MTEERHGNAKLYMLVHDDGEREGWTMREIAAHGATLGISKNTLARRIERNRRLYSEVFSTTKLDKTRQRKRSHRGHDWSAFETIRDLAIRNKVSWTELAERTGYKRHYIVQMVNGVGVKHPTPAQLAALLPALGATLEETAQIHLLAAREAGYQV